MNTLHSENFGDCSEDCNLSAFDLIRNTQYEKIFAKPKMDVFQTNYTNNGSPPKKKKYVRLSQNYK